MEPLNGGLFEKDFLTFFIVYCTANGCAKGKEVNLLKNEMYTHPLCHEHTN